MPPRRSQRSKRPSAEALEALVSSPPQRVRRRTGAVNGNGSTSAHQPSLPAETSLGQLPSEASTLLQGQSHVITATAQPDVLALPATNQLISQVTDEVTKRLQPLLANLTSMVQQRQSASTTSPQTLVEQASGSNIQQVQGLAAIQDTIEVPAVHDGVQSILAFLSGEQNLLPGTQRPNDVFMSVNLPIDARVPAKIRSKIIQNEFVDFGSLLVHPAFEDKFHITLQPSQEGSSPSLSLEPLNKTRRITSIDV